MPKRKQFASPDTDEDSEPSVSKKRRKTPSPVSSQGGEARQPNHPLRRSPTPSASPSDKPPSHLGSSTSEENPVPTIPPVGGYDGADARENRSFESQTCHTSREHQGADRLGERALEMESSDKGPRCSSSPKQCHHPDPSGEGSSAEGHLGFRGSEDIEVSNSSFTSSGTFTTQTLTTLEEAIQVSTNKEGKEGRSPCIIFQQGKHGGEADGAPSVFFQQGNQQEAGERDSESASKVTDIDFQQGKKGSPRSGSEEQYAIPTENSFQQGEEGSQKSGAEEQNAVQHTQQGKGTKAALPAGLWQQDFMQGCGLLSNGDSRGHNVPAGTEGKGISYRGTSITAHETLEYPTYSIFQECNRSNICDDQLRPLSATKQSHVDQQGSHLLQMVRAGSLQETLPGRLECPGEERASSQATIATMAKGGTEEDTGMV